MFKQQRLKGHKRGMNSGECVQYAKLMLSESDLFGASDSSNMPDPLPLTGPFGVFKKATDWNEIADD
jgi:hypothetical protein